jgi:hypothetical protein
MLTNKLKYAYNTLLMNQRTILILLILFLFLPGCVSSTRKQRRLDQAEYQRSIRGWEYVRIERRVPYKDCIYKVQEVCGEKSIPECLNWYKQRAKRFQANTVVLIEDDRSRTLIAGSPNPIAPVVKSSVIATALLADYYFCPKCEPVKEQEK